MTRFDFAFRPISYWDHADPVSAILSNIKGETRRRWVREFVTGRAPARLGEIPAGFFEPSLDTGTRSQLGAMNPSCIGGECLPDYLPGEVEIARVVLESTTQDVISFRARRRRSGRRIFYRVVDEYPQTGHWVCSPASSAQPLTLAQMIRLIDTARSADMDEYAGSLIDLLREGQEGCEPHQLAKFVTVESDIYPGLSAYYREQAQLWLARRQNARS
jgi:hypothetical protein